MMSQGRTQPYYDRSPEGPVQHMASEGERGPIGRGSGTGREDRVIGEGSTTGEIRDWTGAPTWSERQARQLADTMPHIVWTANGEGEVDYFNGRWYEYTGLSPEETLAAMGWRSAVHPDDMGRLLGQRDPAVERGGPFQADVRLRDRDGHYRWHIVRSVPVCDDSGRVDPPVRDGDRHR